ncbi:MAG TPA: type I-MYXAN CRISPR-associated Cas8a1/Cmx1 [Gemmataceae bacterium]|nr:type I-MYXAN CRISPR-associated Cas8a1/Cmx1 [Gemmataceae bacterium]
MRLFAPGMSLLHRAGLGGLACTLKAMEREYEAGRLSESKLPAPFADGKPPWDIDEQSVTLRFGRPENAGEYLKKLFAYAFGIRNDGLIMLPGQHATEPAAPVLADLQSGLTLTFLQHGKVRQLAKEPTLVSYDPEGEGVPGVVVQYRKCAGFKHQNGWEDFVDKNGCLVSGTIKVDGPISPGTVVRHVVYTADTAAEDPPERMLPLYFALVGGLALPVNRGVAALLVPDVVNLLDFVYDRPAMTPSKATECQIANAADAAFRAQVRVRDNPVRSAHVGARARDVLAGSAIPGCYAMTFTPTAWASQQKSRVATIYIPPGDDKRLDRFERALTHLPPRVAVRTVRETKGKGRQKSVTERFEAFRTDSIVRPLIAENLALGRPWYAGFVRLMTRIDPASGKPYRDRLIFERKGLHDMISDETMWDEAGESIVVRAVHEALRSRYGQIAEENRDNPVAMRNRFSGEYDRWRLAFAGAKTADQFRKALCDLFSRAGSNAVLRESWQDVLPMLRASAWQHARDLALLGLCSYRGRGEADVTDQTEST